MPESIRVDGQLDGLLDVLGILAGGQDHQRQTPGRLDRDLELDGRVGLLGDFNDQLVNGKYDGASRKSLQSQSYNTRNSK